jgi:hypothetical protein
VWNCGENTRRRGAGEQLHLPLGRRSPDLPAAVVARTPLPATPRRGLELDGWLYLPMARLMERVSRSTSRVHVGVPQVYLLWIVLGAILVVGLVMVAAG